MKYLFPILVLVILIFNACSQEETDNITDSSEVQLLKLLNPSENRS